MKFKFRIVRYYERFKPQVLGRDNEYHDIGSPTGYATAYDAKDFCYTYKSVQEEKIVEEFEL